MQILYAISIRLYAFVVRIAGYFNPKAKEWYNGRKTKVWRNLDAKGKDVIWFHCASLGEFDQGLPLMEAWKESYPNSFIFVTFFSPSGMLHYHKRNHCADAVDYLPIDTKKNATKFVQCVQPKIVFFVKYEFWAHHLASAKKQGALLYSVSALFRKKQLYFKRYGGFYRKILHNFDHIFVQNQRSLDLLQSIDVTKASISGDLRFDRVFQNKQKAQTNATIEKFLNGEKAFVIGSSWSEDEAILLPFINSSAFTQKVILAPHEITEKHLADIVSLLQKKSVRYTQFDAEKSDAQILILDTIGHLTNAYQYGDFAYVGGGFKGSLHNILEPAVFGLPVIFGPKHIKFPEANLFKNNGFGFEISSHEEMMIAFKTIQSTKIEIEKSLLSFMQNQTGIAKKIITTIKNSGNLKKRMN